MVTIPNDKSRMEIAAELYFLKFYCGKDNRSVCINEIPYPLDCICINEIQIAQLIIFLCSSDRVTERTVRWKSVIADSKYYFYFEVDVESIKKLKFTHCKECQQKIYQKGVKFYQIAGLKKAPYTIIHDLGYEEQGIKLLAASQFFVYENCNEEVAEKTQQITALLQCHYPRSFNALLKGFRQSVVIVEKEERKAYIRAYMQCVLETLRMAKGIRDNDCHVCGKVELLILEMNRLIAQLKKENDPTFYDYFRQQHGSGGCSRERIAALIRKNDLEDSLKNNERAQKVVLDFYDVLQSLGREVDEKQKEEFRDLIWDLTAYKVFLNTEPKV